MAPVAHVMHAHRNRARGSAQCGQALTEFLVVALTMMPLFLLIPMIAKYQDINHSTQMAARYAAFDATIRNDRATGSWKPEAQLADEVRRRFFGNSDAPIKTGDVAGEFNAHRNLFWRGPDARPLLNSFSDVAVSFGASAGSSHADGFEAASDMDSFGLIASGLGLASKGIYRANISVKLATLPTALAFYRPFDTTELTMRRHTSLLLEPWAAKHAAEVESRILGSAAIFPAGRLASISSEVDGYVSIIEAPAGLQGPKLGRIDFWRDVVPADRLKAE